MAIRIFDELPLEVKAYQQPLGSENSWEDLGDGVVVLQPTTATLQVIALLSPTSDTPTTASDPDTPEPHDDAAIGATVSKVILEDNFTADTAFVPSDCCIVWNSPATAMSFCIMFMADCDYEATLSALNCLQGKPPTEISQDFLIPCAEGAKKGKKKSSEAADDVTYESVLDYPTLSFIHRHTIAACFIQYGHGENPDALRSESVCRKLLKLQSGELLDYLIADNVYRPFFIGLGAKSDFECDWVAPKVLTELMPSNVDASNTEHPLQMALNACLRLHFLKHELLPVSTDEDVMGLIDGLVSRLHNEVIGALLGTEGLLELTFKAISKEDASADTVSAHLRFCVALFNIIYASFAKEFVSEVTSRFFVNGLLSALVSAILHHGKNPTVKRYVFDMVDQCLVRLNEKGEEECLNEYWRTPILSSPHKYRPLLNALVDAENERGCVYHLLGLHDDEGTTLDRSSEMSIVKDRQAFRLMFVNQFLPRLLRQRRPSAASPAVTSPHAKESSATCTPHAGFGIGGLRVLEYLLQLGDTPIRKAIETHLVEKAGLFEYVGTLSVGVARPLVIAYVKCIRSILRFCGESCVRVMAHKDTIGGLIRVAALTQKRYGLMQSATLNLLEMLRSMTPLHLLRRLVVLKHRERLPASYVREADEDDMAFALTSIGPLPDNAKAATGGDVNASLATHGEIEMSLIQRSITPMRDLGLLEASDINTSHGGHSGSSGSGHGSSASKRHIMVDEVEEPSPGGSSGSPSSSALNSAMVTNHSYPLKLRSIVNHGDSTTSESTPTARGLFGSENDGTGSSTSAGAKPPNGAKPPGTSPNAPNNGVNGVLGSVSGSGGNPKAPRKPLAPSLPAKASAKTGSSLRRRQREKDTVQRGVKT